MRILTCIALMALLAACEKENRWDCFKSMGSDTIEQRALAPFDAIYIEDKIELVYRYAPDYRAEVAFGKNVIPYLKTEVRDGALYLSNTARCNWVRDLGDTPRITVHAPGFAYMENRGTGGITFADTLVVPDFKYEEWQANGKVLLRVHTQTVSLLKHTGSSELIALGRAQESIVYSASTGRMDASGLVAPSTLTNNSSIQPMKVYSSDYLYAAINGSGDILYLGNPGQIEAYYNGSGRLLPLSP